MPTITILEKSAAGAGFTAELVFSDGGRYPIAVADPFSEQQELELEWYFERWLERPHLDEVKANRARASVREYGESLFGQVFSVAGSRPVRAGKANPEQSTNRNRGIARVSGVALGGAAGAKGRGRARASSAGGGLRDGAAAESGGADAGECIGGGEFAGGGGAAR